MNSKSARRIQSHADITGKNQILRSKHRELLQQKVVKNKKLEITLYLSLHSLNSQLCTK